MNRLFPHVSMAAIVCLSACGGHSSANDSSVNSRDTVAVPEEWIGEDSIACIENATLQSPISAEDLLNLSEVHSIEHELDYYNNFELAKEYPDRAAAYMATGRDSAAMRLANRFMRMNHLVQINGVANDWLQYALAVNVALDSFRVAMPSVPADSALDEIVRVVDKFSSLTQRELNFQSYVEATVEHYRTIEAYRQWLSAIPSQLKPLAQEEYEAWHDQNEARFVFWHDVSYNQSWYSAKPMEIEAYYECLAANRRAELDVERDIIMNGRPYRQKGKTVTTRQWECWIAKHSVPKDAEALKEMELDDLLPNDSVVANRVDVLKSAFSRWLSARQAIAAALPAVQGKSYDNLTADIHCRMIGQLALLVKIRE